MIRLHLILPIISLANPDLLPGEEKFPLAKLRQPPAVTPVASFSEFPEEPSYRPGEPFGERETVIEFPEAKGGADGCTFDAWGNLYSVMFSRGVLVVIDPNEKRQIAEFDLPVKPATNLTFGGSENNTLRVTAGVPRLDNCQLLKIDLGITGFSGHVGATEYPVIRFLEGRADVEALAL